MAIKYKIQILEGVREDGSSQQLTIVAEFNDGYSHIGIDDNCWVVFNGGQPTYHLFPEAVEALQRLPYSPSDYKPLKAFRNTSVGKANSEDLEKEINEYLDTLDLDEETGEA